jgi:hypothetical protein
MTVGVVTVSPSTAAVLDVTSSSAPQAKTKARAAYERIFNDLHIDAGAMTTSLCQPILGENGAPRFD